eukprot:TRINITY_DN34587_c0_g1_i1.p1 TRINITY_DN34587_c0_g1~~TRINITY_DN34587_c0_g1_i1.p1  ORF type:complete len:895 (-),score=189.20 TRINITY_DN34587_c0_g1_i1:54-2738(-)
MSERTGRRWTSAAAADEEEDDEVYHGVVKAYWEDKGYGFIQCVKLEEYGDVFAHKNIIKEYEVNERVSFRVRWKKDKPQVEQAWRSAAPASPSGSATLMQLLTGTPGRQPPAPPPPPPPPRDRTNSNSESANFLDGGPKDISYEGVIKSFNSVKGFGFIRCEESFNKYSSDVFLHKDQLGNLNAGDHVTFGVRVSDRGQPQAINVKAKPVQLFGCEPTFTTSSSPNASQQLLAALMGKNDTNSTASASPFLEPEREEAQQEAPKVEQAAGATLLNLLKPQGSAASNAGPSRSTAAQPQAQRKQSEELDIEDGEEDEEEDSYHGIIVSLNSSKGHAFIRCSDTFVEYGCDIFVPLRILDDLKLGLGDGVSFEIKENNKKQPQAINLRASTSPETPSSPSGSAAERFTGVLKVYHKEKGYGFIRSQEMVENKRYSGQDVFVHQNQIRKFAAGDHVSFTVKVNKKGGPQAYDLKAAQAPEEDKGELVFHEGVLKKVDKEKGFAFIFCQEMMDEYGGDVFATVKQLEGRGLLLGDRVRFSVKVNKRGKPEASNLEAIKVEEDDEEGGEELVGIIKSFDDNNGYGFISSAQATSAYGRDVFLHRRQLCNFEVGDSVSFRVKISGNGQPQAHKLKKPSESQSWLASAPAEEEKEKEDEIHTGQIKSFSGMHGYGFIDCQALRERFGKDVFLHESQYEGLAIGDRVQFSFHVKKGQPQAMNVERIRKPKKEKDQEGTALASSTAASPKLEPSAAPANVEGLEAEVGLVVEEAGDSDRTGISAEEKAQLSRKLLRACASARAESVEVLRELLEAGAEANARDVTGQTALMVAALNVRHAERKCRHLIEHRADINEKANESISVLQWARERINGKFAAYLEAVNRGDADADVAVSLESPPEDL